jgi:hypothetical protein
MRMTIRPKVPGPLDLQAMLLQYLKSKGVKKSKREEITPAVAKLATDRVDLSRVQTNNIRCECVPGVPPRTPVSPSCHADACLTLARLRGWPALSL